MQAVSTPSDRWWQAYRLSCLLKLSNLGASCMPLIVQNCSNREVSQARCAGWLPLAHIVCAVMLPLYWFPQVLNQHNMLHALGLERDTAGAMKSLPYTRGLPIKTGHSMHP